MVPLYILALQYTDEFVVYYNRNVLKKIKILTCYHTTTLGLFIDVGTNYSVLDHTNLSFIYEDVLSPGPNSDGEFVSTIQWAADI